MYEIVFNKKFKSSYKRIVRSGRFNREEFKNIMAFLEKGFPLPTKYHDHALTGDLYGQRECHISGDMLLLYEIDTINNNVRQYRQPFSSL